MSGVRIKDLQDAKGVIEKFDEMQFAVDSWNPDSTLRLSGKELKKVIGTPRHTHPIEEVNGLPGVLEKKLDTTGGTVTGDLRVEGDTHVKNIRVDEYLEVPELKYNRITATGNEFWVTDGGVVDDVATDGSGVYLLTLKGKEGEPTHEASAEASSLGYAPQEGGSRSQPTTNFQFKDILRAIFYTENRPCDKVAGELTDQSLQSPTGGAESAAGGDKSGESSGFTTACPVPRLSCGGDRSGELSGFTTAYYEVTGVIDQSRFYCVPLNGIPPQRFMTLARQGNKSDENRQGAVYMDGLRKFIRVSDKVADQSIDVRNIRVQIGNLSEIDHPVFGRLKGYGALLDNAYICGRLVQRDPVSGEDWVVGAVSVSGEQVFHYDEADRVSPDSIIITAKEQGFTSAPETRQWQYKNGSEWVTLDTQHVLTYVLTPDAEIWRGQSTLTLRYIVAGVYYDMITVTKVRNGDAAYIVSVDSSNGNQFLNGEMVTILTATVFRGSTDITADIPYSAFNWTRLSDNPAGDTVWNERHIAVGNQITVTGSDVYRRAVFNCEVNIP